jgi:hypothetical protein
MIDCNSSQILSKHLGPSVQWHVPTWTALAPQRIISKASVAMDWIELVKLDWKGVNYSTLQWIDIEEGKWWNE